MDLTKLETILDVKFLDKNLLSQSMVHKSFVNENSNREFASNERLEYLGDAILGWVVASELYLRFPDLPEGILTKGRSIIVRGENLAKIALDLRLDEFLLLGRGEFKTGGSLRNSNLAGALEALIGALFLDQGVLPVYEWVKNLLANHLESIQSHSKLNDSKSALQELAQQRKWDLPTYEVTENRGISSQERFHVSVLLNGRVIGSGVGPRRTAAEQKAAGVALIQLESSQSV